MTARISIHQKYEMQFYDKEFKNYDKYQLENWRLSYLCRIFKALHLQRGLFGLFLDIGVGGSGYTVIEAARKGYMAVGIDISKEGVKKAMNFSKKELGKDNSCNFVVAVAENLPFKHSSFDKISSIAVIEHVSDDEKAIEDISYILKSDGEIYITVPNAYRRILPIFWLPYRIHDKRVGHLRHYSERELISLFNHNGLKVKNVFTTGHHYKIFQIIISKIFKNFENSQSWWKLENLDINVKIMTGLQLHLIASKKLSKKDPECLFRPKLLYIFNGQGLKTGLSGGDLRFIQIANRLKENCDMVVLSTIGGLKTCLREKLNAKFIVARSHIWKKNEQHLIDRAFAYIFSPIHSIALSGKIASSDIIYTTSDFVCDVIPAFLLKLRNPKQKWVAMIHHCYRKPWKRKGDILGNWLGYFSQQFSFALIKEFADAVFVYRSSEGEYIQQILGKSRKEDVFFVKNGINFISIKNEKDENKVFDACFVAGLRESKGVFDLIKIWKKVCENKKNAKLAIIGSGKKELEDEMKKLIREFGITPNIIMLGQLPNRKIFKKLKQSKVFISPSFEEGWGIAVCEAMACGLPVVAWDLPVYRRIFPKGIMRIGVGNINNFAESVLLLLRNKSLRKQISEEAFETASSYDWDEIAKKEFEYFEEISTERIEYI